MFRIRQTNDRQRHTNGRFAPDPARAAALRASAPPPPGVESQSHQIGFTAGKRAFAARHGHGPVDALQPPSAWDFVERAEIEHAAASEANTQAFLDAYRRQWVNEMAAVAVERGLPLQRIPLFTHEDWIDVVPVPGGWRLLRYEGGESPAYVQGPTHADPSAALRAGVEHARFVMRPMSRW